MDKDRLFAMLDPATDQFLWACSGPTSQGRCAIAEKPPYVCQGLRLIVVRGTRLDGLELSVESALPGRCPLAWVDHSPSEVAA